MWVCSTKGVPRVVKNPEPIKEISYRELRELSYMGASVMHEDAVFPVRQAGIPINIRNTNKPDDAGTWIVPHRQNVSEEGRVVTGIAGMKGFSSIRVEKAMLKQDLSVDRYQLHLENESFPSIYFRYTDAVRQAKEIAADKKDALTATLAERRIAILEDCVNSGKKSTEAIVQALVDKDEFVLQARKELREANAMVGRLQSAVSSLDTKRESLDNLVKLYCNNYYANKDVR